MKLNPRQEKVVVSTEEAHKNHDGGISWDINDPVMRLKIAASSCFFGEPTFYAQSSSKTRTNIKRFNLNAEAAKELGSIIPSGWAGKNNAQILEQTIDEALDFNAEATLMIACELRNSGNIRVTPQVIMVRAAHHKKVKGTGLVRKYAPGILKRADEPATQLAYHISLVGDKAPIPNCLKRSWAEYIETLDEYALAKYKQEGNQVSLKDVVKICHPKHKDPQLLGKLVKDELKVTELTWEGMISTKGSNTAAWTEAAKVMPHMALLRNLRNLLIHGVDRSIYLDKFVSTAKYGRQFPFRYLSAFNVLKDLNPPEDIKQALTEAFNISCESLPKFPGRVMSLVDNSGSTDKTPISEFSDMNVRQIGNLMGVITSRNADEGFVGVFGDTLEVFEMDKKASPFVAADMLNKAGSGIGQGTEAGIWNFFDRSIREKLHWDYIFVYSDMQAGHGGLYGHQDYGKYNWRSNGRYSNYIHVPRMIADYRKVNRNVKVFLVQIAGYTDSLVPEYYPNTFILGGWSPQLLNFAAYVSNLSNT